MTRPGSVAAQQHHVVLRHRPGGRQVPRGRDRRPRARAARPASSRSTRTACRWTTPRRRTATRTTTTRPTPAARTCGRTPTRCRASGRSRSRRGAPRRCSTTRTSSTSRVLGATFDPAVQTARRGQGRHPGPGRLEGHQRLRRHRRQARRAARSAPRRTSTARPSRDGETQEHHGRPSARASRGSTSPSAAPRTPAPTSTCTSTTGAHPGRPVRGRRLGGGGQPDQPGGRHVHHRGGRLLGPGRDHGVRLPGRVLLAPSLGQVKVDDAGREAGQRRVRGGLAPRSWPRPGPRGTAVLR